MKNFANPDSEIAVNPFAAGGFSQNPTASFLYDDYTGPLLIVWQSDQNGNFDLYSITYDNGQFGNYQQITSDLADDVNPDVSYNLLVWEREGKIYFSSYSPQNTTWSSAEVVDSVFCSHPVISYQQVAYQKEDITTGLSKICSRRKNWPAGWFPVQNIWEDGDNRFPVFEVEYNSSLLWQNKTGNDWNIMSGPFGVQDTSLFIFSPADETCPRGLDIDMIVTENIFYGPMFLTFESNVNGDPEIYTHDYPGDYANLYNLSQHPGEDRHPVFSEAAMEETPQVNYVRFWLTWESYRNGQWQIWGSYSEMSIDGIEEQAVHNKPYDFELFPNYPNPFNPGTAISYQLSPKGQAAASNVELIVYNLLGQKIRTLVNAQRPAGRYEVQWDGRDDAGKAVASGIYLYRLRAGDFVQTRKMILLR